MNWVSRQLQKWKKEPEASKGLKAAAQEPAPSHRFIAEFLAASVYLLIKSETIDNKTPDTEELLNFARKEANELSVKSFDSSSSFSPAIGIRGDQQFFPLFTSLPLVKNFFSANMIRDRAIAAQVIFVRTSMFAQTAFGKSPLILDPGSPSERLISEEEYRAFCSLVRGE